MESSKSLPFESFESKKMLHSDCKTASSDKPTGIASEQNPWSSKTPEKSTDLPRRFQNRRTALSLKEVRQAAEKLRRSDPGQPIRPDPVLSSAKRQITSCRPGHNVAAKWQKGDDSVKLPEKHEMLDKFFKTLDSSIRLLRLKGYMSTFTNISPKVECLTDRRFSHGHLAQLKFLLPEAIEIKKVLIHDELKSCMKPDLHVVLKSKAIKNDDKMKSGSGSSCWRKIFHARILAFYKAHPEEDVPEETLPEPFNRSNEDQPRITIEASGSSLPGETSSDALPEKQIVAASHLSQSFRGHFCQQISRSEASDIDQEQPTVFLRSDMVPVSEPEQNQNSCLDHIRESAATTPIPIASKSTIHEKCLAMGFSATPTKKEVSTQSEDFSSMGTPSTSNLETPAKLMSVTPALQAPKRCYMSPDDVSPESPNKLRRRPTCNRLLKFDTPVKNAKPEEQDCKSKPLSIDDIFYVLPENFLQKIQEKEKKALEEQDPAMCQAKRRRHVITCLPKLFDMIHFLFQSMKRSVIVKDELMHKIVSSHFDIADTREIEERLRLLLELLPGWIHERSSSSGDILLCINKTSNPASIRSRLMQAS